jgi:hypothetical protein
MVGEKQGLIIATAKTIITDYALATEFVGFGLLKKPRRPDFRRIRFPYIIWVFWVCCA